MVAILAIMYVLTVLAPAPNSLQKHGAPFCSYGPKPTEIAMSREGDIGAIFPKDPIYGTGAQSILWIRRDGRHSLVPLPSAWLLSRTFRMQLSTSAGPIFQELYFQSVRLTDDGEPVATVASHFWGAFGGVETAVFIWDGFTWENVAPQASGPTNGGWRLNSEVGAAISGSLIALNLNYRGHGAPDVSFAQEPNYELDEVNLLRRGSIKTLGAGTATSMRGEVVGGFQGGFNPFRSSNNACVQGAEFTAVTWTRGASRRLGPGVVNDVNAAGVSVGSDSPYFGGVGHPTLWYGSRKVRLASFAGTAYGISANGVIVGEAGNSAFVTDIEDRNRPLRKLDGLIHDRSWNVVAAYAVSDAGDILASAHAGKAQLDLVLLRPDQISVTRR